MVDLDEKATDSPEVTLIKQAAPGAFVRREHEYDDDLVEADELSAEGEFPQYGDFLPVSSGAGDEFLQVPKALAQFLVEEEIGFGDGFRVVSVRKVDGEFELEAERLEDGEVSQLLD